MPGPISWPGMGRSGLGNLDSRDKWRFCLRAAEDTLGTGADLARRARRNHSPAFKAKAGLAAIRGGKTLWEPAQPFDIHANPIKQRRDPLLSAPRRYQLGD